MIIKLAKRINSVGELHGAELITCYKENDKYIVLEGNRRTCACKLLLDRSLIPDEYKTNFPFISDTTKENIERVNIILYPDRESVQAYLSDRYINGVKKWSALEKNNYYMNLFQLYSSVDKISEFTSDTVAVIKKCITKYQFFMDVFHVLKEKYANIEIENLDYLPMVDRFMDTLVGGDSDVGLNLVFDEAGLRYNCDENKKKTYKEILEMVGYAFLLRKDKKYCADDEISKIISSEIYGFESQKKLIVENERIPGLLTLIKKYNDSETVEESDEDTGKDEENSREESPNGGEGGKAGTGSDEDSDNTNAESGSPSNYVPPAKFKPKRTPKEFLNFTTDEAKNFNISGNSAAENKILSILFDLSNFSVYKYPYSCALLYRTLLESCTRLVYDRNANLVVGKAYSEKSLVDNIRHLNNNFIFNGKTGKDVPKRKEAIKTYLKDNDIIQILNLYIHYPNPVDEQLLLSSWSRYDALYTGLFRKIVLLPLLENCCREL